jgi:L-2-hydroxyglutarate oxidase LhgO
MIALATPVVSARAVGDGVTIEAGGAEPMRFAATIVVNAAGLNAQTVARAIDGCRPTRSRRCSSVLKVLQNS